MFSNVAIVKSSVHLDMGFGTMEIDPALLAGYQFELHNRMHWDQQEIPPQMLKMLRKSMLLRQPKLPVIIRVLG